jgi:DNA-binding response OmpR family regulator
VTTTLSASESISALVESAAVVLLKFILSSNGFELYTEMRKIDNQAKFCFITAGEMYYDKVRVEEEQYCKLDTERFLQKPISNTDLVNRIYKLMTPDMLYDLLYDSLLLPAILIRNLILGIDTI